MNHGSKDRSTPVGIPRYVLIRTYDQETVSIRYLKIKKFLTKNSRGGPFNPRSNSKTTNIVKEQGLPQNGSKK